MSDNSTVHRFNALEFWLVVGLAFGLATVASILALLGGPVVGQPAAAASFARNSLGGVLESELIVACFLIAALRHGGWRLQDFNFFPSWRTTLLGVVVAIVVILAFSLLALFAQPFLGSASGHAARLPALGQLETGGALLVLSAAVVRSALRGDAGLRLCHRNAARSLRSALRNQRERCHSSCFSRLSGIDRATAVWGLGPAVRALVLAMAKCLATGRRARVACF